MQSKVCVYRKGVEREGCVGGGGMKGGKTGFY
jgi:hypothetical protein